ncbi:hypothetical protein Q31a_58310 [Aureliella helgolandensis]|uniref:Uncharacterized protein n=1 Tax=Aureliella helgolandensis TaxID=2527968 RepID=A0A518GFR0_9BACT|nr:hypothetical protein Q31a_58310 [Aureliella helgolandensis]
MIAFAISGTPIRTGKVKVLRWGVSPRAGRFGLRYFRRFFQREVLSLPRAGCSLPISRRGHLMRLPFERPTGVIAFPNMLLEFPPNHSVAATYFLGLRDGY